MARPRRLLAIVLIATALCADRVAIAAPTARPQSIPVARQIVNRLVASFRQIVPAAKLNLDRSEQATATRAPLPTLAQAVAHPTQFVSTKFRLPPPQA